LPSVAPASPPPAAPAGGADASLPLTHAVIDRVASDHTRELSKCDGGEDVHGEITVRFAVDAAGKVIKAQVASAGNKPTVAACILRSVQKWQFPPQSTTGAQGTYTLSF
jgi:TonB family protein